jgi:hypothetical protein
MANQVGLHLLCRFCMLVLLFTHPMLTKKINVNHET